MKKIFKKIIPKPVLRFYHWLLAYIAAFYYGYPSNKMIVIGVTGTAGKSTVVNLLCDILEQAGFKVGITTTFNFKIAGKEEVNKKKMTMLGRFSLQRLLKQMLNAGCQYAIIETTSQGVRQYRHLGINYDIGIFTNLSPEHIESHGSFEKYRKAKQEFFRHLSRGKRKTINNKIIKKVNIVNLDDENAAHFLKFNVDEKYGYTLKNSKSEIPNPKQIAYSAEVASATKAGQNPKFKIIKAENIKLTDKGSEFTINKLDFKIDLLGKFNIYNSLSAICAVLSQRIDLNVCAKALKKVKKMPGRMETVIDKPFRVIIDYAHTPDSLKKVYETIRNHKSSIINHQLVCVLGSAGGGRDKRKRPILGALAEKYCDKIIITNEDPYNEDPKEIIDQIAFGIKNKKFQKIVDRRKAIQKALNMAQKGDIVVITGKGCEPWIMGPNGQKIAWDDREIVREEIKLKKDNLNI
ncbi:UDP-N-acetylmuramoyl-L-alanyl-D-glutamate--2,6-diaminopimelate ligase [bacterium]|nr:UDP-N-acetylmuramoyl-L-alanyl-D-glutamate--2,6-diaminopimelate ligase [bacterium]